MKSKVLTSLLRSKLFRWPNNGLSTLQSFSLLNHYLPNLANLSLQNNRLSSFKDLDRIAGRLNKGSLLRELVLLDNPLRDGEGRSLANYKSCVPCRAQLAISNLLEEK